MNSQERFGWERPGWFSTKSSIPVEKYDWYGAYDTPLNPNDVYKTNLNLDYTFEYPSIHENVSRLLLIIYIIHRKAIPIFGIHKPCGRSLGHF